VRAADGRGTLWSDVDGATQAHRLATTSGVVSTPRVGGFAFGDGIGAVMRTVGVVRPSITDTQTASVTVPLRPAVAKRLANKQELQRARQRDGGLERRDQGPDHEGPKET
jgi:hypothetical protein